MDHHLLAFTAAGETTILRASMSRYTVYVDDNYHSMDDSSRYKLGEFEDCQSAVAACKRIVDECLARCSHDCPAEELYRQYKAGGEDPWISTGDPGCHFSAWEYAKARCRELTRQRASGGTEPDGRVYSHAFETLLNPPEAIARLKLLGEPWWPEGGCAAGGMHFAVHLENGTAMQIFREESQGPATLNITFSSTSLLDSEHAERLQAGIAALLGTELPFTRAQRAIGEAIRDGSDGLGLGQLGLTELPPEMWRLTNLEWLDLSGNCWLRELPPEIGRITNLQELCLSGNRFTALPPEIGRLERLTVLQASRNCLTKLPREIGQLTQLRHLELDGNRLAELPPEIGQLTSLARLWLQNNRLTALPPEMGRLNLKDYDFSNRKRLPPRFPVALLIGGNPLIDPPPEIRSTQSVLKFLRAKLEARET